MSFSNALQVFVYDTLVADAAVGAIADDRIYDRPPAAATMPYLTFGPSDYRPDDADCIDGRVEVLQIDCWSIAQDGKREVKALADAVKAALHRADGALDAGALVSLEVILVRILDDPDGITAHGIVQIEAMIEEASA